MFKDDDEHGENVVGAVRYPCMPSLVALQQMRNRLNLAYLGRKLMKWTALATGRELRRLSAEINECYESFGDDMRNAFLLLARSRYFYPDLNQMVLENVQNKANVRVTSTTKTLSGVKVLHYDTIESAPGPYTYLGISKGGEKIKETKEAWLELIKRMILMLELRSSFALVEAAHKNATKKQNVLGKVVVPRTQASIVYINDELEEIAREEFFRLKKILEIKRRAVQICDHGEPDNSCEICKKKLFIQKENLIGKCIVCNDLLHLEEATSSKTEEKVTDKELLESFKSQIENIVNVTKDIEDRGIITTSVEEFLKTAVELKEMLQKEPEDGNALTEPIISDISVNKLCSACLKRFNEEQTLKEQVSVKLITETKTKPDIVQSKSSMKSAISAILPEFVSQSRTETDLELGTFETEIKEVIRIVRVKNEDGSVIEDKKVIKIKKEVRAPLKAKNIPEGRNKGGTIMYQSSDVSSTSNEFSGSKTVGMFVLDDTKTSQYERSKFSLTSTIPRSDMSVSDILFSNNTFDKKFDKLLNLDENNLFDLRLKELFISSSDMENILKSVELQNDNTASTSKGHSCSVIKSKLPNTMSLNGSKNEHLNYKCYKSVSETDIRKNKEIIKKSISFQIENKKYSENMEPKED
ncbi:uncharacterized protein LOC131852268 [Achroia grisella]|uniref:uncharacterized protein LOC131852268 n=1 Tax=Achroia grisella TaxID=688607 RepID=UPI0027D277C6|nr:uncharacterized protein LOC131852268 [Achroia grisella]